MKYLSILFVFVAVCGISVAKAQSTASLNGKSYTLVLNDVDDQTVEIVDKFTFSNNTVVSDKYSAARGFTTGNVAAKTDNGTTYFEVTFTHPTEGTVTFKGQVVEEGIYGDALVTQNGVQKSLVFRGMTTEQWQRATQQTGNGQ